LFAKLYAFVLSEFTNYYTDVDKANREVNRILDQSIDYRIEMLLQKLKEMELKHYFSRAGIKDKIEDIEATAKRYEGKIEGLTAEGFIAAWENWDTDNVITHLNRNINLSIQNYKNNV